MTQVSGGGYQLEGCEDSRLIILSEKDTGGMISVFQVLEQRVSISRMDIGINRIQTFPQSCGNSQRK